MKQIDEFAQKCREDFWYYPKRIFVLSLWIFTIMSITDIYAVRAETGTLTIDAHVTNTYPDNSGGVLNGITFLWTKMFFDSSNYNHITDVLITFGSAWTFAHDARSTDFTITAGGTGSGTVTYNKNSKTVYFFFNDATITSSPVTISYTSPILDDITDSAHKNPGAPGVNDPVYFAGTDGTMSSCSSVATHTCTVQTNTFTTFFNNYNVTYNNGLANVSIDKSMSSVNSKIEIRNQTAQKFIETTFNTVSFSYAFVYDNELILNMSDSAGNYDLVLVNSSGGVGLPTPTPTPPPAPSGGGAVSFDKANYTINDIGIVSWNTDSSIFDFAFDFNIKIINSSGVIQYEQHDLSISGNFNYQFKTTGTYTANFYKTICVLGICSDNLLGSASATVQYNPSYLYINSTIPTGTSFNASYIFGNTPKFQGELNSVIIEFLGSSGYEPISTISLGNNNISSGITYTVSLIVPKPGTYRFTLFDLSRGKLVSTISTAVDTFIPPTNHIIISSITTDQTSYYLGQSVFVSYAYDDTNYSNYQKYFTLNNTDNNLFTIPGQVLYNQVDSFELPLDHSGALCTGTVNCYVFNSNVIYYAGNNQLNLMVTNSTTNFSVASVNFFIAFVDTDGYGLSISPNSVCTGQNIIIRTSGNGTVNIMLTQSTKGSSQILYRTWETVGNNRSQTVKLAFDGDYAFYFLDDTGHQRFSRYAKATSIGSCITGTPTSSPTTQTPGQKASDIANLLDSNIFWALIFTAGLMIAVAIAQRGKKDD